MKTIIRLFCLSAMLDIFSQAAHAQADYTVHEWGTFTDVQGGDGKLLSWRPLQTSELPNFVRDWKTSGMNRRFAGFFMGNQPTIVTGVKEMMVTLQRLETPVMYFYSDEDMTVDVNVKFPGGLITEWFPQATQIGPSFPLDTNVSDAGTLPDSRAVWKHLQLFSESKHHGEFENRFPPNQSGSHYFAARETAADTVRTEFADGTKEPDNYEKFIFYRGAGSFKTPLVVSVNSGNEVVVENSGAEKLSHLFLVSIHNGRGAFALMDELPARNPVAWMNLNADSNWKYFPLAQFQNEIGAQMESALTGEGLFADEAKAMVNTWKDSWFMEEGERVLYILPRAWTDETLPMTLNPKPEKIVRVMVGRAEVIAPSAEMKLSQDLSKAQTGDANSRGNAIAELKTFGRFAEPALNLALRDGASTNAVELGYQLLFETMQSKN
ncbi:MAG TPA: hypothetical protein VGH42_07970 [Verrucomicrobiae bacterium]|jgi:hypothetical protein